MSEGVELATGILNWSRDERLSGRYGTVTIGDSGNLTLFGADETPLRTLATFEHVPVGSHGRLVAVVNEVRQSSHIGDGKFNVYPPGHPHSGCVPVLVGDRVVLGEGALFVETKRGYGTAVGVRPDDDRLTRWMDVEALYRVHEQTVTLVFEKVRQFPRLVRETSGKDRDISVLQREHRGRGGVKI